MKGANKRQRRSAARNEAISRPIPRNEAVRGVNLKADWNRMATSRNSSAIDSSTSVELNWRRETKSTATDDEKRRRRGGDEKPQIYLKPSEHKRHLTAIRSAVAGTHGQTQRQTEPRNRSKQIPAVASWIFQCFKFTSAFENGPVCREGRSKYKAETDALC